ncbi:hypothetical protein [Streptomyces tanashiensis]|uniref:hypothetical protein n=1 Tax=Streptomyces tanashiensis TaxID=67367 RepID=UPI00167E6C08|nr:hypothetical protein [Streptomyces tanashiensis]GGY36107.1 hypothetical protein GCM10010299_48060 [Streptomyces tanashiensis]
MGADIDGVVEVRERDGRWRFALGLPESALVRDRHAREVLFGYGGALRVERPLFDLRGCPDDVSDVVPSTCEELHHSHSYATWAEIAAVDWDGPLCDGPDGNHIGEWRPGPDGSLVLHDVPWTPVEVLDAAEELFGEDLMPPEWPAGGEVHRNGAVYRPVTWTPRMFVPPDGAWSPVWTAMRELATAHGDENVRLVVWFG